MCELPPNGGLSERGAEERRRRNLTWFERRSQATSEVVTREAPALRRSSYDCYDPESPPFGPWQRRASTAAGLLLAGLVALTQAWCVNSLHENLLWFSELTVRVTWDRLPVSSNLHYSLMGRVFSCP